MPFLLPAFTAAQDGLFPTEWREKRRRKLPRRTVPISVSWRFSERWTNDGSPDEPLSYARL
jgi:hypothetical protein